MILEIIFILVLIFLYKFFYKPWKEFHWYADTFQKLGYKVYRVKWTPLGGQMVKRSRLDYKQHGDVNYFWKHQAKKYDIVMSNVVNQPLIYLINPDLLKQFFSADKVYIYNKNWKIHGTFITLGGRGIVFDQGHSWKKKRKTLNNVFTFDFIKNMIPLIKKEFDNRIAIIQASKQFPRCYIYQQLFSRTLGAIAAKTFFGQQILQKKIGDKDISVFMIQHVKNMSIANRRFDVFLLGPRAFDFGYRKQFRQVTNSFKIYKKFTKQFLQQKIKEYNQAKAQKKQIHKNILNQILKLNDQAQSQSQKYTFQDITSQFNNVFIAALDTTSQLMTMMVYYLALNPDIRKKAIQQIQKYIKDQDDINYENLKKMTYIDCIQKQTLRCYGPGHTIFLRQTIQDHKLKDVPIWKGTLMMTNNFPNNYNEKYYKDPYTYKPERWLQDNQSQRHPFSFAMFAAGPRSCIGKQLALLESKIILSKFLRRYGQNYQLQKKDFKMITWFGYVPQKMDTILVPQKLKQKQ